MIRTLSVRVEVVVDADDTRDAREVGADLAQRASKAIETSHRVQEVQFASAVLYRLAGT